MSQYKDWYPKKDAELLLFAENYVAKIEDASALAGLNRDTFLASKRDAGAYIATRTQVVEAERQLALLRKLEADQTRSMSRTVRAAGKQLRNTQNINPEVLLMLELEAGPATPLTRVAAQAPALVVSAELGVVYGRYTRHSHQGIDLYSCRTGEKEYTLLGRFNMSRWEDRRPNLVPAQPEQRDYYAVFVDRDQQMGAQSPTVSVVVGSRPG
jgi:hypothetical protein